PLRPAARPNADQRRHKSAGGAALGVDRSITPAAEFAPHPPQAAGVGGKRLKEWPVLLGIREYSGRLSELLEQGLGHGQRAPAGRWPSPARCDRLTGPRSPEVRWWAGACAT